MRKIRYGASGGSEEFNNTSIFITPMLDMTFQLLTFFIFTYNPSALEGQFPITLAAGHEGGPNKLQDPTKVSSPNVSTETRPAVTVVARSRDKGRLGSLEILVTGGKKEMIKPAEGSDAANLDEAIRLLLAQLELRLMEYRQDGDRVMFQASAGLRWEDSMMAIDSCRQTSQLWRLKQANELQKHFPDLQLKEIVRLFPKVEMDLIRAQ